MHTHYDVIVIGGGHAGAEAAWAAASALAHGGSRGLSGEGRVALITMDPSRIGQMSCNPAIGGLAKGQMVREIDALGGLMGLAIDATGIMFKMLNTSKGAAVRGPRAQADKYAYAAEVQRLISTCPNIDVIAGTVDDIVVENGCVVGVVLSRGDAVVCADEEAIELNMANTGPARPVYERNPPAEPGAMGGRLIRTCAVVLTTGTFMRGLMHTGEKRTEGGRVGEGSAISMSATLRRLGFELGRLKTGTPPRLARESIDFDGLDEQVGDAEPIPFSDLSPGALPAGRFPHLPQVDCHITSTTAAAHELIRANLHRAPMYTGQIEAECGPRYCPSIEDKVVRFPDRESHHVFLEPESLHTNEIYCNGISTSLPIEVQERIVHLMPGCERAKILRWGYAVEYDMIWPHQIDSTCMAKSIAGLFLAGQINCTTGYEEAAGQGLIAGLNAARLACDDDPIRLRRDQAYIGVMLDDLVTRTPREPYRMFTSRAEHRLLLRADNADERLTPLGRELGLVDDRRWAAFGQRRDELMAVRDRFDSAVGGLVEGKTLREIARRPGVTVDALLDHLDAKFDRRLVERVMTDVRYEGYIARQNAEIKRQSKADGQRIPSWLDFCTILGLRAEAVDVLAKFRPATMGQAGRLAGVTPADLTLLAVTIRRGPRVAVS
ncbi:MAG: tRNA uridine-5-carboxymethylaminomethyl(34) synthesis enzyme MnmG [Planctomycetes bacterium]|nr:tRNA uridine-5-carboxymethylaminomethyl(34) synthesis enzyme MnmG [Planctomycetota bacterium]